MTASIIGKPLKTTLAAMILASGIVALPSYGQATDFDAIKAAAAKEGTLVVWHNTPSQETTKALNELFNRRFDMNIKVNRVSVSGSVMTSRLMTEKRGGKFTVDVFIANDRHLPILVKNGMIEKIDWVGEFAGPGKIDAALLTSAATNIISEYIGYGLEFRHTIYGIVYNTKMVTAQDVPKTWEGLADPKWRGKVVIEDGLSPLGRDGVLDLAKRIVANRPIYADGQPASAGKIVSGEAPIGAVGLSAALEEREKGAPIGLIYAEPQALISQLVVYVAKGAPHPNLAKLWAAWMASEGMNAQAMIDEGAIRAWPGSPGAFGEHFAKHNLKVRRADTIAELEAANDIRKELDAVATGRLR